MIDKEVAINEVLNRWEDFTDSLRDLSFHDLAFDEEYMEFIVYDDIVELARLLNCEITEKVLTRLDEKDKTPTFKYEGMLFRQPIFWHDGV